MLQSPEGEGWPSQEGGRIGGYLLLDKEDTFLKVRSLINFLSAVQAVL